MPKITIPVQGGKMSGYLTLPKKLPAPGVLVIQEIFGVNKVMRDLCDAYAKEGYVALCPDLFWRIEPGIDITDKTEKEWQRAFELFGLFDVAKGVEDLKAALAALRKVKGCNGRAGSVGYCLGGKLAYLMATRSDADCNVSFYGVGIEGMLGEAGGIKKPLMLHIAGKDKFVSPAAQTQIRGALSLLPQVSIHVYDEQGHAFARIGGQHYDKAAATLANGRTRDFFARHLKKEVKVGDKVHAIRFEQAGGPEVMKWTEQTLAKPGKGEVLIRHTAIGLNYIDTYHRTGLYPMSMPSGLGLEAAGTIEAVGPGVKGLKVGDRVAYCSGPIGAYAQARVMPAEMLVPLPSGISDQQAAAVMLQGLTVQYLIRQIFKAKKGDTVLFHAAAGGVGLIACQWLKALGVTVIGTAGSKEKAALAKKAGCKHVILYREEDVAKRVKEITKGKGVPVVFDGVGKDTWMASLDSLSPRGLMVSFGNASGPVAPFAATLLAQKGSLFLTRPTLAHYANNRENLLKMAKDLFGAIKSGKIKIEIHQTYPLKDAAQAHRDLEARKTTGSTLLLP